MPNVDASASKACSPITHEHKLLLADLARSAGIDLRESAVSALADALAAGAPPPSLATVLGALCKARGSRASATTTTTTEATPAAAPAVPATATRQ